MTPRIKNDSIAIFIKELADLHPLLLDNLLQSAGGEPIYLVGGFIRDVMVGRKTFDIDIVSPSSQAISMRFSRLMKGKRIFLSKKFPIIRVILKGKHDINVDFSDIQGGDIRNDLKERDFTIDAMAIPLCPFVGALIDPSGGREDIKNRLIRMVSERAFIRDPVRILRAYRLATVLNFGIDEETRRVMSRHSDRIPLSPHERVRMELFYMLKNRGAYENFKLMVKDGVFHSLFFDIALYLPHRIGYDYSLPLYRRIEELESEGFRIFPKYDEEIFAILKEAGTLPLLKLSAILFDIRNEGEIQVEDNLFLSAIDKVLERTRLSSFEKKFLLDIINGSILVEKVLKDCSRLEYEDPQFKSKVHRFFKPFSERGLLIILLHGEMMRIRYGKDPFIETRRKMLQFFFESLRRPISKFLNGNDLIKARVPKGPQIGRILERVHDAEREGIITSKEDCIALVEREFGIHLAHLKPSAE